MCKFTCYYANRRIVNVFIVLYDMIIDENAVI